MKKYKEISIEIILFNSKVDVLTGSGDIDFSEIWKDHTDEEGNV